MRTETNSSASYFDKVSSSVEWAQWFAFLNIALSAAIGLRYLIESPLASVSTLDHFYSIVSLIGHFGFLCFITSGITKTPLQKVFKEAMPMVIVCYVALILFTYVPSLVTWLPSIMG